MSGTVRQHVDQAEIHYLGAKCGLPEGERDYTWATKSHSVQVYDAVSADRDSR